ncbi:transcription termination factor MTERF6, chloroplastic/mitochondrial-like [Macadamia integrifolia]|uniref:transcription termination factor MTERF6, chloroplastic/mitochondrial-like n=1 Tax=Macadamia integrifolia TaxID=60698 RepID=UPI001C4F8ACF|nr:transcription termination factor MTERF6, chloroplastic/mitochondrial-like [Macadamia integrifolia]
MEELGLDAKAIGRILSRCPEIFASSIERTLRRKVKYLADIGISSDHLPRVIGKYPELLVSDIDSAFLPRMRYLMRSGLSKRELASMIRRFSPLLGYSIEEVLRPKLEFLVNTMEKPIRDVVEYPRYFSYSLDKKIKPRFWVLKGRDVDCSLKDMLGKNDEDFATDYMGIGRMLVPPPSSQEWV